MACPRAIWAKSAWRSPLPTRPGSMPPSRQRRGKKASTPPWTGAKAGKSAAATSRAAPGHTITKSSTLRPPTRTCCTRWTSSCTSPGTVAAPLTTSKAAGTSTPTTTPSGSIRKTAGTCSWAPTAACTRALTKANTGGIFPTSPSRNSTSWGWTTASPSTTSSAGRRTSAPCWAPPAPAIPRASATRTGTFPWEPMATIPTLTPKTPTSSTWSTSRANSTATTGAPRRPSTSSRNPPPAIRPSAGTGTAPS